MTWDSCVSWCGRQHVGHIYCISLLDIESKRFIPTGISFAFHCEVAKRFFPPQLSNLCLKLSLPIIFFFALAVICVGHILDPFPVHVSSPPPFHGADPCLPTWYLIDLHASSITQSNTPQIQNAIFGWMKRP